MSGPVSAARLKSFLERVEKLLEERAEIQSDIKDVFAEAKGVGYDVKTMRRLIQIRAQDSADRAEQEALLDTYMVALGMSNGATAAREPTEEELEARARRIVDEVDRCMALMIDGKLPKISAIQAEIGCSLGKASKLRGMVEDRISRSSREMRENENETADRGRGDAGLSEGAPVGEVPPADEGQAGDTGSTVATIATIAAAESRLIPRVEMDVRTWDEVVGDIPSFLDRRTA